MYFFVYLVVGHPTLGGRLGQTERVLVLNSAQGLSGDNSGSETEFLITIIIIVIIIITITQWHLKSYFKLCWLGVREMAPSVKCLLHLHQCCGIFVHCVKMYSLWLV